MTIRLFNGLEVYDSYYTVKVDDLVTKYLSDNVPHFSGAYDDGRDESFEDDGFLHICVEGTRYVFYNGQEKGMLRERNIPKYKKLVTTAIKQMREQ